MTDFVIRNHKGRPGVGRFIGESLGLYEATSRQPTVKRDSESVAVNYGVSRPIRWIDNDNIINTPLAVHSCVNKLATLKILRDNNVPTVLWTQNKENAMDYVKYNGPVYCRTLLNSKQGNGIVVAKSADEVVDAELYTYSVDIKDEFRVHVAGNRHTGDYAMIDFTQKKRMGSKKLAARGIKKPDLAIRNRKRGWVMAHNISDEYMTAAFREHIEWLAVQAARALDIDYAGVDMALDSSGQLIILEVNSAPGMSKSTTKAAYVKYFEQRIAQQQNFAEAS